MRKSILAMMFGKYVDSGAIRLDATMADLGIDDTLGHRTGLEAEVIDGLQPGDAVVRHPGDTVGDGVRVAPRAAM